MQIGIHEIEDQINVSVVLSTDNVLQADDILMARQLLQEDDFSESSLCVRCVLKGIEILLERDNVLRLLVDGLPHDTVSSLTY
jgi:hypothetical protein